MLDLGAAPGSWTLYASERVGPRGRVVAIDQRPIELPAGEGLTLLTGDLLAPELPAELLGAAPYQVVLSDMAPSTTGSRVTDQARSLELFLRALSVADRVAAPGGAFVGKLFMSADFPAARRAVETRHEETRVVKPEGTRSNSVEVFVIGLRRRPSPGAAPPAPG